MPVCSQLCAQTYIKTGAGAYCTGPTLKTRHELANERPLTLTLPLFAKRGKMRYHTAC